MTTLMTRRSWTLSGLMLVALGGFAAARAAPPDVPTAPPAGGPVAIRPPAPQPLPTRFVAARGFFETFLAPRMSADPPIDDAFMASRLGDPASRRWANDPAVVALVERRTIRSFTDAFKGYAIEQLGIDHWSIPLVDRGGGVSPTGRPRGVRIRLGFSRLAPRADVLMPVSAGRLAFSVDARGEVRASFDPRSTRFQFAADVDVPQHTAAVSLGMRF